MKSIFTNNIWAMIALLCLGFTSCSGDDEEDEAGKNPSCVLNKLEFYEDGLPAGYTIELEYNSLGNVSKAFDKINGTVVATSTFEYNSQNKLVKSSTVSDNGEHQDYNLYEYNTDGTVKKKTDFYNETAYRTEVYTYDGAKRLIKRDIDLQGDKHTRTYTYVGTTQNIAMEMATNADNSPGSMVTYEDYDDKLNPMYAIKGIPRIGESRNNARKSTYTYEGESEVTTFSYKYNASGYATEVVEKLVGKPGDIKTVFNYTGCQ